MKVLKYLIIFLVCIAGGFLIGSLAGSLISGKSVAESVVKLKSLEIWEFIIVPLVALGSALVSFAILVIIHEAGHLVAGLLTGYKFVSFRIFNLTFIKENGKIKVKRFSIAGTGGQCLLTPPDLPADELPVFWYNIGGVLANVLALLLILPLFWIIDNPFGIIFVAVFAVIDLILILMNGIPMNKNGLCNDAGNIGMLRRNLKARKGLMNQLNVNAMIQNGFRPKDIPESYFTIDDDSDINFTNPMEVSVPLMHADRLIDAGENEKAYGELKSLYIHKDEIMGLYVKEIACELAYTAMTTGRIEEATELLDEDLMKYLTAYSKVMSSKQRILFAKALLIDRDYGKAEGIYKSLLESSANYLLQGEVKSDLDLMQNLLSANP